MNKESIINVKNLYFSYNFSDYILNNVSFSIDSGDLVGIIGPNGSGKSTLMKVLLGLLEKEKGSIKVGGRFSYIPQKFNQDPNFPARVDEILSLECCECNLRNRVLKSLGIENLEKKQFKSLSGGQQQRVLIALSLLSQPDILVLDEPTVGVDSKTLKEFYELLNHLNKTQKITILLVTHDTSVVSNYFTKLISISSGKVIVEEGNNLDHLLKKTYGEKFHN